MKKIFMIIVIMSIVASTAFASDELVGQSFETNGLCRGCCSHHGGLMMLDGIVLCGDGTPLSVICKNKGCDKGEQENKIVASNN